MCCVREDDDEGGGDDDRARDCDRAGYDDFTNCCVSRERNELDSSIDQIICVLVLPVMVMVVRIRIPYFLFSVCCL